MLRSDKPTPSPLEPFAAGGKLRKNVMQKPDNVNRGDMSDEPESGIFTTPSDEQAFEPLPLVIHDGSVAIFDQMEFGSVHNCLAARFIDGYLSVLDRDSGLWRDIGNPRLESVKNSTKQ